jgi:hypothetical protein
MTPSEMKHLARMIAHELHELQTKGRVLISQNEAYKLYGRTKIQSLKPRLKVQREGNRIKYNRKQIEALI